MDKVIATNRRARHEYEILNTIEAGLVLFGPEVKALRAGRASLSDAYGTIHHGELFIRKLHIGAYEPATNANADPLRERKLLVHKREIAKLEGQVAERGLTLVPLSVYFKEGRAKVELGLARGKRQYDKRQALKKRQDERETQRTIRTHNRDRREA
jgi:SsrA-binding protein